MNAPIHQQTQGLPLRFFLVVPFIVQISLAVGTHGMAIDPERTASG
uniref:Uncharacterized protein n=1 Tax=Desertifilum tharense IPPAS B-1220 TaxID=1781255 RepID=A0ACD5GTY3_9CYAN